MANHAKRSKWYLAFGVGASTVVTDLGIQVAKALSNHTDVNLIRPVIVGAIVGAITRLIGMALAAYVTSKEKEESEDGESTGGSEGQNPKS